MVSRKYPNAPMPDVHKPVFFASGNERRFLGLLSSAGIFISLLMLTAAHSTFAASLTCQEVTNSPTACDFVIIERDPSQSRIDAVLDPHLRYVEDFLVLGGQTVTVPDSYIGKSYCPGYVSAFRDRIPQTPPIGVDRGTWIVNTCFKPAIGQLASTNFFGYFGPTHSVVPAALADPKVQSSVVEHCVQQDVEHAGQPYDYNSMSFPAFYVTLAPNDGWAFDVKFEYVTQEESQRIATLCHGKWVVKAADGSFSSIADFAVPTYFGYEQAMANVTQSIDQFLQQRDLVRGGLFAHAHITSHWFLLYAEISWEVRITKTSDENSLEVPIDNLSFRWGYPDPVLGQFMSGNHGCGHASYCSYGARIYMTSAFGPPKPCMWVNMKLGPYVGGGGVPNGDLCFGP
jgi:hypothetical protein